MHSVAARSRLRAIPGPRVAALLLALLASVAAFASTGLGAASSTQLPTASVVGTLSMTDPVGKSADPPVCGNALAPLDTDDCTDVTFAPGASPVLSLGSLAGTDVQAGSLRWTVTTTNPLGYQVVMENAGAAPLLRSATSSIPDMQTSPLVPAASVDDATHFGVAMGDPAADNESAVDYPGSPWVTAGQQGERFSGIPVGGMVVARQSTPQTNDPFTATFAVASIAQQQPATGSYAGTVRVTASAL